MRAVFAASVFVAAALASAQAGTISLYYHVRSCTPDLDCGVNPHGTSPDSPGPTDAAFRQFYGAELGLDLSGDAFAWTGATNANGTWFGSVDDAAHGIHSSYLWQGDRFLCCTIDEPYAIVDGNDHDHFIGYDENGASNAGQPLFPAFLAGAGGPFALPAFDYALLPGSLAFLGADASSVRFVAIDDGDTILASWARGWLEFDPAEYDPVPEPAAGWLALPFALILLGLRRRISS